MGNNRCIFVGLVKFCKSRELVFLFGNYVEVISLTAGRPPGFLGLSHGLHDGLAGHSRHENHHGDTHRESANDRQIVQVGGACIAADQPGCVFAYYYSVSGWFAYHVKLSDKKFKML